MKKLTAAILVLCLATALCACAPAEAPTASEAPDIEVSAAPTDAPQQEQDTTKEQSLAQLNTLLADFAEKIQAGTAGSSLKAAAQAARLMDWAVETPLSDEEISAAAQQYISALDDGAREEYDMQIYFLDSMYKQLLQPLQETLLEAAGVEESGYPYGEEPLAAVETLMSALGQRSEPDTTNTAAYDEVLRGYYNAMAAAKADPDGYIYDTTGTLLNPNLEQYVRGGTLGFCYYDANGDGITELLIGTTEEFCPKTWVFDMYTLVDGQCVAVFQGWERNFYVIIPPDGTIENIASAGAANYWYSFYGLQNGALAEKFTVVYDAETNPDAPYYRQDADGTLTPLAQEEAAALINSFQPTAIPFEYSPISALDISALEG